MHLIALPDIHGHTEALAPFATELAAADVVLLPGDLTDFGGRDEIARVVKAVRMLNPNVRTVTGNCDLPPEADAWLAAEGLQLDGRCEVIKGVALWGCGGSLPCPGKTPHERSEAELAAVLAQAADGIPAGLPSVLVVHQPPFETFADFASNGAHVGSRAVREAILMHRPLLCLSGHIHEGRGVGTLGNTTLINPGPLRGGSCAWARIDNGRIQAGIHTATRTM